MIENTCGFAVLLVLSLGVALLVHLLVRKSLRSLLDDVVALPSGTTFYTRILVIGVFFIALSGALGTAFDLKKEAAFMEYVWKIARGLSSTFGLTCLFLTGYLLILTILVAVLRRRHE
jgi:hypothetical protein